jgi:hypothetical protein
MTNCHATVMIYFVKKKKGSSQLMVSEQFALRVLRRVESIVRLGAQRIKITFATVSGFFRWAGCLNKILICLELNPFLLQISSFIPNSNA